MAKTSQGSRNKKKGKAFERECCDIFKAGTGLSFQRVPGSGAYLGGRNVIRADSLSDEQVLLARGDIICPTEWNGAVVECKARASFSFNLLFADSTTLNDWIDQCNIDYKQTGGKFFAVIFKVARRGTYIVTIANQIDVFERNYLAYTYDNTNYTISEFDEKWVKDHKDEIETLCRL